MRSRHGDSKGHANITPNNMSLNNNDNNGQSREVLSENPSFSFAHTKAERLSTAVHMVTRFMGVDEPLRRNLRSESLNLLSRIFIVEEGGGDSISGIITRTISLLDIAYRTQYISEMNWNVIRGEYVSFGTFFEERNLGSTPGTGTLSKSFFDIEEPKAVPAPKTALSERFAEREVAVKDRVISKGQRAVIKPKATKSPVVKERKNGRRGAIVKLLRKQKKITVRDAVAVVPGVSEKTLQRELISMVKAGILRREGERRWSTYFLA
jgi:hypothetical protein